MQTSSSPLLPSTRWSGVAPQTPRPSFSNELEKHQATKGPNDNEVRNQIQAITKDLERVSRPVGGYSGGLYSVLDSEDLGMRLRIRVPDAARQLAGRRLPPRSFEPSVHDFAFVDALIDALADLQYTPAVEPLFKLRGRDYDAAATRALSKLAPARLGAELVARAQDKQLDSYVREQALVAMCRLSLTNCVRELVPLLEDETPIVYERPLPGPEWRICDRAAASIAMLLGWEYPMVRFIAPQEREGLMKRAREWAKSGP